MRKICLLLFILSASISLSANAPFSVYEITCDYSKSPLGVDRSPFFSWKIHSESRGFKQSAYQIIVSDSEVILAENKGNIWDSKEVKTPQSVNIPFNGAALRSGKTYFWKVRCRSGKNWSPWSDPAEFTTGLLSSNDWGNAKWIALEKDNPDYYLVPGIHGRPSDPKYKDVGKYALPQFRKDFEVKKPVKKALVFVSGLGHFELFLNGTKTGQNFLDPGWTKYDKNALYVTFDITSQLKDGMNAFGVMLGNGFYNIPNERYLKQLSSYGAPKMILKMQIEYADGTSEEITSGNDWKCSQSPITYSSIYGGEDYDATKEQQGWKLAGFNDSDWQEALEVSYPGELISQKQPLAIRQSLPAVRLYKNGKGFWVYDLGQNFSGILRIKVKGSKGQQLILRPAELQNPDSTVNQRASGEPFYFTYTLGGEGKAETWQPQFTYYGFRYVQLEGAVPVGKDNPGNLPEVEECIGLHTTLSADEVGTFACSSPLYNKIYELIDWSIRSNLASVLTDCPHREKLGWLEVAHLMQYSVQYRYSMPLFYQKIMNDMYSSQNEKGVIATIAPEYVHFEGGFEDTPEWGSAFIISPWYVYKWYNDKRLLERYYPQMQKYLDYLGSRADNHIVAYGLGDWFDIGPNHPGYSQLTSNGVTATSIYYYNTCIMKETAELLGKTDDAERYGTLAANIKEAFNKKYYNRENGTYDRNSQTASAITLYTGLVEEQNKGKVLNNLITDIRNRNNALTAGDVGYRYVLQTLADNNAQDVIYDMNSKYDVPGYGWQLAYGATSLTESWQAYGFVSNNHCMLGHLMEWLFSGLGGIKQTASSEGFSTVEINPQPAGDITNARTSYISPYGMIRCEWEKKDNEYTLLVEIPANSDAIVHLPTSDISKVREYGVPLSDVSGLNIDKHSDGQLAVKIGSGKYMFTVSL